MARASQSPAANPSASYSAPPSASGGSDIDTDPSGLTSLTITNPKLEVNYDFSNTASGTGAQALVYIRVSENAGSSYTELFSEITGAIEGSESVSGAVVSSNLTDGIDIADIYLQAEAKAFSGTGSATASVTVNSWTISYLTERRVIVIKPR